MWNLNTVFILMALILTFIYFYTAKFNLERSSFTSWTKGISNLVVLWCCYHLYLEQGWWFILSVIILFTIFHKIIKHTIENIELSPTATLKYQHDYELIFLLKSDEWSRKYQIPFFMLSSISFLISLYLVYF